MYYLFRFKNILPAQYARLGNGEKQILHAFVMQEIEDLKEETTNK